MGKSAISPVLALAGSLCSVHTAHADCKCVANGERFEEGQVACLTLPMGKKLAQCTKVLNNSSWKILQDGCPESSTEQEREVVVARKTR